MHLFIYLHAMCSFLTTAQLLSDCLTVVLRNLTA